jgi:hypothetical protein
MNRRRFLAHCAALAAWAGVVAYGAHVYLTEDEFSHAAALKGDLNAQFGDDFNAAALRSPGNPGAPSFWGWTATFSTPLYPKA